MKKTFTFLLFIISQFSFAQNLVPNPSFEKYDTCPDYLGQINRAIGWSSYSITPDYYNSCAPENVTISVSVPSNYLGFQYARTGNAYSGIITFDQYSANEREYIGIQLNQSLTIGQKYFASFYISRAVGLSNVATNKIGLRLSTVSYSNYNPSPINNFAQVYTDSIIIDTLNWIQITGSFIADSVYRYLSIGNFFQDSLTSFIAYNTFAYAYYYIDDVYLSTDSIEGINDYSFKLIKIFPNPARDWIAIEGRNISKLSLFDVLGNLCFSKEVSFSSLEQINVSNLSSGIYFLNVQTSTESTVKKIIINN